VQKVCLTVFVFFAVKPLLHKEQTAKVCDATEAL